MCIFLKPDSPVWLQLNGRHLEAAGWRRELGCRTQSKGLKSFLSLSCVFHGQKGTQRILGLTRTQPMCRQDIIQTDPSKIEWDVSQHREDALDSTTVLKERER